MRSRGGIGAEKPRSRVEAPPLAARSAGVCQVRQFGKLTGFPNPLTIPKGIRSTQEERHGTYSVPNLLSDFGDY